MLASFEPFSRERERGAHPLQDSPGIRGSERPGLELQAHGAGIPARTQRSQQGFEWQTSFARQAMLVPASFQVGVGEVDVAELGG